MLKKDPVKILASSEPWNEYRIPKTGDTLQVKLVISGVFCVKDHFDNFGEPFYILEHQPPSLRVLNPRREQTMKDAQTEAEGQPIPERIYELISGAWRGEILKTAIQLDIFKEISDGLRTVEAMATHRSWAARPTRILLDSLCPLGFLVKSDGEYGLTPISRAFLVSGSKTFAGNYVMTLLASDMWGHLIDAVRTGHRQVVDASSAAFADLWKQDAALESARISHVADSLKMWRVVGIDPDTKRDINVLDLGSGCGMSSFVLPKHNPRAKVTCADWAGVLEVARELAENWHISKQVVFQPGDLTMASYGDSIYDAVLLGRITYYLSVDQNKSVLTKVYRALKPAGLVVINAPLADERRSSSDSLVAAVVVFLCSENGDIYTFQEYKAMLEEVGYTRITKHGEGLVSAMKQSPP